MSRGNGMFGIVMRWHHHCSVDIVTNCHFAAVNWHLLRRHGLRYCTIKAAHTLHCWSLQFKRYINVLSLFLKCMTVFCGFAFQKWPGSLWAGVSQRWKTIDGCCSNCYKQLVLQRLLYSVNICWQHIVQNITNPINFYIIGTCRCCRSD